MPTDRKPSEVLDAAADKADEVLGLLCPKFEFGGHGVGPVHAALHIGHARDLLRDAARRAREEGR